MWGNNDHVQHEAGEPVPDHLPWCCFESKCVKSRRFIQLCLFNSFVGSTALFDSTAVTANVENGKQYFRKIYFAGLAVGNREGGVMGTAQFF